MRNAILLSTVYIHMYFDIYQNNSLNVRHTDLAQTTQREVYQHLIIYNTFYE